VTIARRGELEKNNKTHGRYMQVVSNATFSGQLVTNYKVKPLSKGKFEGTFGKKLHKRYKNSDNKPIGKKASPMYKIASGLSDRGWKFYGITEKARERIMNNFRRYIRRKK
jgi:hypothetical protein